MKEQPPKKSIYCAANYPLRFPATHRKPIGHFYHAEKNHVASHRA